MNASPYHNVPVSNWLRKTEELLSMHPLNKKEIVDIVLNGVSP
jgi:hypothetical protein